MGFVIRMGYTTVEYNDMGQDTIIEITAGDPFNARVLAVKGIEDNIVHYSVNVLVTIEESRGIRHGWRTYKFNMIEQYFWGEEARKRYNVLEKHVLALYKKLTGREYAGVH